MNSNNIDLKTLKKKRIQGEVSREVYWLEIQNILTRFQELIEIQSERVRFIGMQEDNFFVQYSLDESSQIRMLIDPSDLRSAPLTLIAEGSYEEFECHLLLQISKLSTGFCDIGANIGFYTLAAASVNSKLLIFSFEPNPDTGKLFLKNLNLNSKNIQVINIQLSNHALGSKSESDMELFIPLTTGTGGGSFVNQHPDEETAIIRQVKVEKLDKLLDGGMLIDLVKIDVEGIEFEVILGGLELIRKMKPTIFIELLRKWMKPFGKHPQDVVILMQEIGYECYAIECNRLARVDVIDEATIENNFVFVHPERIEHFALISGVAKS